MLKNGKSTLRSRAATEDGQKAESGQKLKPRKNTAAYVSCFRVFRPSSGALRRVDVFRGSVSPPMILATAGQWVGAYRRG
jgi:hypothetical protein